MQKERIKTDVDALQKGNEPTLLASPRNRSILKKSRSMTGSSLPSTSTAKTPGPKRQSFLFRPITQRKSTTSLKNREVLDILKKVIATQIGTIEKEIAESLSPLESDHTTIAFHLEQFTDLKELIVTQHRTLEPDFQAELDLYVYQNTPPSLVYLYCESLMNDKRSKSNCDRSNWLISLMGNSLDRIANTLIYIATDLELSRANSTPELAFREDSLANFFSVCYAKTHAADYLDTLVIRVTQLMRSLPDWPQSYNIDADSTHLNKAVAQNFSQLMHTVSKLITHQEHEITLSRILTLRYDLMLTYNEYDPSIARLSARSFFWLRLFSPLFRQQVFSEKEQPIVKRIATLLTKASSNSVFNYALEKEISDFLNSIITSQLDDDFSLHFNNITSIKPEIIVYDFRKNTWNAWQSLLPPADIESSLTQLNSSN